jgi:hypothetical protein
MYYWLVEVKGVADRVIAAFLQARSPISILKVISSTFPAEFSMLILSACYLI